MSFSLATFKEGRKNEEDLELERRLSTSITETVINKRLSSKEYCRIIVRQLHVLLNTSVVRVLSILAEDLRLKCVCARRISKLLIPEQMQLRVDMCAEWKGRLVQEDNIFSKRINTAHEYWLPHYDTRND